MTMLRIIFFFFFLFIRCVQVPRISYAHLSGYNLFFSIYYLECGDKVFVVTLAQQGIVDASRLFNGDICMSADTIFQISNKMPGNYANFFWIIFNSIQFVGKAAHLLRKKPISVYSKARLATWPPSNRNWWKTERYAGSQLSGHRNLSRKLDAVDSLLTCPSSPWLPSKLIWFKLIHQIY